MGAFAKRGHRRRASAGRARWPALALALAQAAACARAARPTTLPDAPAVRDVRLEGASRLDPGEVLGKLATRGPGPWPWSAVQRFDPAQWDVDLRRIERVYEAEGFYGTQVVDSDVERGPDGVRLWARVREAPPTIVRRVEVTGADALPPGAAGAVRSALQVHAGQRFRDRDWEATRRGILEALRERGYARAAVDGDARVDPRAHTADLALSVRPGRVYRFGDIYVADEPSSLPAGPPLAIARSQMPSGEVYSPAALVRAQEHIFGLGAYSAVAVSAAAPDPATGRIPILVELRDAPRYALRLGGGVQLDPARQAARAATEWVDRDFLGGLRTLRLAAHAGVAFVPSVWSALEGSGPARRWGPLGSASVDLGQPVLAGVAGLSLFASAGWQTSPREIWSDASVRGEAGVIWRIGARTSLQASWGAERWWLWDTPLGGAGAPTPAFGCAGACTLAYLEQRLTLDARNDPRETRSGYLLQALLRELPPPLGTYAGVVAVGEARGYLPLTSARHAILASRLRLGSVGGNGPPPVMLRFFSGGPEMRGFGDRRLAPRLRVGDRPDDVAPTGGQALLEGTLEARLRVHAPLWVVGFVDAGAVTLERFDPARLAGALQVAAGAGVRWTTRFAPIRVDLAVLLPVGGSPATYTATGARIPSPPVGGCFGLGGASGPDGRCVLRFWIGEAF